MNAYELTCPGAQRVVEAVEARESKRPFHLRNKKTVADQIQKCAPDHVIVVRIALADHADSEGDGLSSAIGAAQSFLMIFSAANLASDSDA